jgi:cysteine synthase A
MKIAKKITELVGHTPLLEMTNYENNHQLSTTILGKLEFFNPAGSAKDRIAKAMIEEGFKQGTITKDSVLIEPTSGNTGIGLASIAASYGIKAILTMPETMSVERRNLLKAYGAQLELTPGSLGMKGAIEKAEELAKKIPHAFIPSQFTNQANPNAHYNTTGPEIWEDTEGKVDIFVAGVGTGGTISGVGKYLKEKNPNIQVIAVEPADSPLLTQGKAGSHKIQGIGANFVPKTLNTEIYDEIVTVTTEQAYEATREASKDGILIGVSSGAALWVAEQIAKRPENKGKIIVVFLPDSGERYISIPLLFS